MIVEPVPATPRSTRRRFVRAVATAMPAVILVAVAGAGLLGRPAAGPPGAASPGVASAAPGSTAIAAASAVPGSPRDAVPSGRPAARFPSTFASLPVRGVTATLDLRAAGGARGIVAVAGYLDLGTLPAWCVDRLLDADRGGCTGRATLAEAPSAVGGGGPHLHPRFPPGVTAPVPSGAGPGDVERQLPVVVLGRFDDPLAGPCAGARDCAEAFVVARVAWADGGELAPSTVVDPALLHGPLNPGPDARRSAAVSRVPTGRTLLGVAYLTPAALAAVDPTAARSLATRPGPAPGAVWYVRSLATAYDPTRDPPAGDVPGRIGWTIVDAGGDRTLAAGDDAPPWAGRWEGPGNGYPL